jgi:hypothetical protein
MLGEMIPHAGCVGLYHLEADGSDSSGNSRTLTAMLAPTYAGAKFGNGASPNGYVLYRNDALGVDLGTKIYGFSFWFVLTAYPEAGAGFEFLFWGSTNAYTYHHVRVSINDGRRIQLQCMNGVAISDFEPSLNTWYKCDVSADGTYARLYINGSMYLEEAIGTTPFDFKGATWVLGNSSECIAGQMDEVVFFDYDRTAAAIARQYSFEMGMLG